MWKSLSNHPPTTISAPGLSRAAVAVIVNADPTSPEVLFIQRAIHPKDPWSGQMAFPGGRKEEQDSTLLDTAVRETNEEIGVKLNAPIGQLDEQDGRLGRRPRGIAVTPFVFETEGRPEVSLDLQEVQNVVWIPMNWILSNQAAVWHPFVYRGKQMSFPAIQYEEYVVWGLTYRMLQNLFMILGKSIPRPL